MNRSEIYKKVTDTILEQLEQGIIPWERPWFGTAEGPRSGQSGEPYSMLNQMLLIVPGRYFTFAECIKLKANVKKGSKSKQIVFFKPLAVKDETTETGMKTIPMLKYFNVFHESQIDNLPEDTKQQQRIDLSSIDPESGFSRAEQLIREYTRRESVNYLETASNSAYYNYDGDKVVVPLKTQFKRLEAFYGVAFHELAHSTKHEKRLNRDMKKAWGDDIYAKEELIAEFSSAFLLHNFGLESVAEDRNTAAYIQSWSNQLRADPNVFISASSKAKQAVDFIIGKAREDWNPIEEEEQAA